MKTLQQHIEEKLVVNKDFKEFTIKDLKDSEALECIEAVNQHFENEKFGYDCVYKVYDYNGSPHMFVKRKKYTALNDDPSRNQYGSLDNWIYNLYYLRDNINDFILDNIFGLYSKWHFIDTSSRINNLGCTAHGFYVTNNGMLFNSAKEARKFIRDNKLRNNSGKALHPKSLRELFDIYKECEKYYEYQRKTFGALSR